MKLQELAAGKAKFALKYREHREVDVSRFTNEGNDDVFHATNDGRWICTMYHSRPCEDIVLRNIEELGTVKGANLVCDNLPLCLVSGG